MMIINRILSRVLGILSLSLITATAAKALRTPGLPPHIRTAALVLGAAGWMQVRKAHLVLLKLDLIIMIHLALVLWSYIFDAALFNSK